MKHNDWIAVLNTCVGKILGSVKIRYTVIGQKDPLNLYRAEFKTGCVLTCDILWLHYYTIHLNAHQYWSLDKLFHWGDNLLPLNSRCTKHLSQVLTTQANAKIHRLLNGRSLFDAVFHSVFVTLKLTSQIKATEGITGLICITAHIH